MNLYKTEKDVEYLLENFETTRTSDNLLFVAYWMKKAPHVSFIDFRKEPQKYGASSYKSVERCRRKIQARRPELKDSHTAELREEAEMDYIDYSIGG
jgi:hypothetical protein